MFIKIPCPGMYLEFKNKNPKLFVEYCKAYIKHSHYGLKAVGVETSRSGQVYILTIPDYDAKRPVAKGRGKSRQVILEPMYKVPIENFLSEEEIEYLKRKGMDKYGNKIT
ncbi:hypothetical protein [Geobacillus phage TP-84]|uniref:Uncharacterized protein n=1 Tax=Geobacillus phage TP-84 TaxID=1965361 RepID=A0A1U9WQP0_9CAUD|nr:hypothetical protein MUK65_gp70 [Geobacillus phage TP-84]AQY55088.1 hypothetical protein [Geobacillus phage TP-84]